MKRIIVVAGILAAVASHRCIDLLTDVGLAPDAGRYYAHVAVDPTIVGSVAMLAGLFGFAIADRGTWFADLVREIERTPVLRIAIAIFTVCAFSLFAMESFEQLVATGRLCGTLTWLGTTIPVALTVFGTIAVAMSFGIVRGARSLLDVICAVRSMISGIAVGRRRTPCAARCLRFARAFVRTGSRRYARSRGLRAPPQAA